MANPALDDEGNIYVTFSGIARTESARCHLPYRRPTTTAKPFVTEMMNPTGLPSATMASLYVSSRYDGTVYRVAQNGAMTSYAEGMGVATGIAFDDDGNLYVGDRSGTIFKIGRDRQIFVFATIEPSVSAYHLAFDDDGNLYVTGPTTSSFDAVYQVDPAWPRRGVLSRPRTPAGTRVRQPGQSLCRRLPARPARHRKDHARCAGVAGSFRTEPCWPRLCSWQSACWPPTAVCHHLSWDIAGRQLVPLALACIGAVFAMLD